ncbi:MULTISPECIES: hypothetical protein [unclassified Sphingobium]|uniref:Abi-alpha family protein n=1 Tax=unclassified Sphingobium TaxID=2611147 RepID=UPI0022259704|nr:MULTISPECIES: hypothetical protein [unclassified Sphingobium]MCW2412924.1 hypothetical protein [Sphingobium sp. B8D3D]MCW2414778.1 hypothetical protein [Sphingobium sp. B8D3A]
MGIDPTEIVTDVSKPFTGTLSDAWAWVLGDRVAAWRLRNAAKIQVKVNEELAALGLKTVPTNIPERYAFAWFEEATKQDEDDIQILFARLLARAATGDENALDRRLLDIVSRMVPADAQVLAFVFAEKNWVRNMAGKSLRPKTDYTEEQLYKLVTTQFDTEGYKSIEHMTTLGIFERSTDIDQGAIDGFVTYLTNEIKGRNMFVGPDLPVHPTIRLTMLGAGLVQAIRPWSS